MLKDERYAGRFHGGTNASPRGSSLGVDRCAPPYRLGPPSTWDASGETLRTISRPFSPPSVLVTVGFPQTHGAFGPFSQLGGTTASCRNRRSRSVAIVIMWLLPVVYKMRSHFTRSTRRSVISTARPIVSALSSMATKAPLETRRSGRSCRRKSHALCRRTRESFPSTTDTIDYAT